MPIANLSSKLLSQPSTSQRVNAKPTALDTLDARAPSGAFPRPFGVEIEMAKTTLEHVSAELVKALPGRAPDHSDVFDAKGRRWEVKHDIPNIEIATPILQTYEDLSMVQRVVSALSRSGARCDANTGVHVHVDAAKIDAPALTYMLALVARHEPYLYSALGVERFRRQVYCRPLGAARVDRAVRTQPQTIDALSAAMRGHGDMAKFTGLNLEPIFSRGGFGTIEFRYFNGCLDPHAIGCYVGYAQALMHHTAISSVKPAQDEQPSLPGLLHRIGLGPEHAVSRMLCGQFQRKLEASIATTPRLAALVRSWNYTGDAALLWAMGVPAHDLERALNEDADAPKLLARAVSVVRYLPVETAATAFVTLRQVPREQHEELVRLAQALLEHPRFAGEATRVFTQLCQVPQPQRRHWAQSAKNAPVSLLVRFSHEDIPTLARVFALLRLEKAEFSGTFKLAKKILRMREEGPLAAQAKAVAISHTGWLGVGSSNLRGRLAIALLDHTPGDIAHLATLTQPILSSVPVSDIYVSFVEAFCAAKPGQWAAYARQLKTLIESPHVKHTMFALQHGFHNAENLLSPGATIDHAFIKELASV